MLPFLLLMLSCHLLCRSFSLKWGEGRWGAGLFFAFHFLCLVWFLHKNKTFFILYWIKLMAFYRFRSSRREVFCKKRYYSKISQNPKEKTCSRVYFLIKLFTDACSFMKKRLAEVPSCRFCEICKEALFSLDPSGGCFSSIH